MPEAPIFIKATGRGSRQRIVPDKHGTPRGKGYRKYCKLPKDIQKNTQTPSHKKRAKRVHGVATGDYVRFTHKGTPVYGYGTISKESVALTNPVWKSVKATRAAVVERNHGYQVTYPTRGL